MLEELLENEAVLNQVKVRANNHGDQQLHLRFRGLSDFYIPYRHIYSSVPLTLDQANALIKVMHLPEVDGHKNPFFHYSDTAQLRTDYFNIVQITAPRRLSQAFQQLKLRKGEFLYEREERAKKLFRSGHFDEQARWNLPDEENYLQPGAIIKTDEKLIGILKKKRELDKRYSLLRKKIRDSLSEKSRGQALYQIRRRASDNDLEGFKKSKYYELLGNESLDFAKSVLDAEKELTLMCQGYADFEFSDTRKTYELFLHKRPKLEVKRQLSLDEWLSLNYVFFDIETPKFLKNDLEVCQVAAIITKNKEINQKVVFNRVKANAKEINGNEIRSDYENDCDMIEDISDWILENDVDVLVAYNLNFDASMLRKRGNFYAGEAEDEPKKDVTKKFFERFRMDGGFCIDLLRLGQTILRGFPNAKLEMLSRFLNGAQGYRKSISYQELEELQYLSEGQQVELSSSTRDKLANADPLSIILNYVAEDTEEMPRLFFTDPTVIKCLGHLQWMANNFKMDFTKLIYSPMSLREVFDRGYFKHMGIQRDEIYPRGIKYFQYDIIKNKEAVKDFLSKQFESERLSGTHHNVERRFIPIAFLLRDYLSKKTHTVREFVSYVEQQEKTCSAHEFIFLSHYLNGIADYILTDFGAYLRMEKKYDAVLKKLVNDVPLFEQIPGLECYADVVKEIHQQFFRQFTTTRSRLDAAVGVLNRIVQMDIFEGAEYKIVKASDIHHLKKINEFRKLVEGKTEEVIDGLVRQKLTVQELHKLFWTAFNYQNIINKVEGNHQISPKKIKGTFELEARIMRDELEKTGKILALNAPYVYLQPYQKYETDYSAPISERVAKSGRVHCCPCQNVLEHLFISDKEYSREEGFVKGVKIKDGPSYYSNAFYSDVFLQALESFWKEEYAEGVRAAISGFERIRAAAGKELIFHNKTNNTYFGFQNGKMYEFMLPGNENTEEIPVHGMEQFNPDHQMYISDFSKRMKKFVRPVLGKARLSSDELYKVKKMFSTKRAEQKIQSTEGMKNSLRFFFSP